MSYAVKEIFYTLQGEGARTGRAAVFLRFAGCNLWTGLERDRPSAVCRFCDTDFVGLDGPLGGRYDAASLAAAVSLAWGDRSGKRYVVVTGGEPLLQLDAAACDALHREGFEVAIETNGTLPVPTGVDWVCVSPKAGSAVVVRRGNELKLVVPQDGQSPADFEDWDFEHWFVQPRAVPGPGSAGDAALAVEFCRAHPRWRLSLQTHKLLGIP